MAKNPKLKQEFIKFKKEYLYLGHMIPVEEYRENSASYYIPHQAVIKESSTTTKLRVMFDATCKTSTRISLNELMHKVPRLQQGTT